MRVMLHMVDTKLYEIYQVTCLRMLYNVMVWKRASAKKILLDIYLAPAVSIIDNLTHFHE